ncbi:hypothetical protein GGQ80_001673 [Sphingomonas jinjuensis]|uniref:Uncharacterized protein n=1 Tax=Sphingomonas jinjuensis TaxID=535907 RepID=A0A840FDW0_9SPHN|nr:hypothetical protein [Sphingomonas jinjuensis]MBB4153767.1 hypothetical protein [Sphingomonas jinjuensis]
MLLHERVEALQKELERMAADQKQINLSVIDIDRRVVRIEALIEFSSRQAGGSTPRLPE